MLSNTPAAPIADQTMKTATQVTMPNAIESRNAVFITDHGSSRDTRRRAFRVCGRPEAFAIGSAARLRGRAACRPSAFGSADCVVDVADPSSAGPVEHGLLRRVQLVTERLGRGVGRRRQLAGLPVRRCAGLATARRRPWLRAARSTGCWSSSGAGRAGCDRSRAGGWPDRRLLRRPGLLGGRLARG